MFYDSSKQYNKKEEVFIRTIIPIISSHFRMLDKIEYDYKKDLFEVIGDDLTVKFEGSKGYIKKNRKLTERDNVVLKIIKHMVTEWEKYK